MSRARARITHYRKCCVEECDKNSYRQGGQGYCENHWRRLQLYGDPHGGMRAEKGAARRYIETTALTFAGSGCLTWPFGRDGNGYADIHNPGGTRKAHRLICELAHGAPPTPDHQAAHSCGKGHLGCVNPQHLAWKTSSQNQLDRVGHDTHIRGERNFNAVLTVDAVRQIKSSLSAATNAELARLYGVNQSTISAIRRGLTWRWVT